ncbi:MAG: ABC transporter permease [Candidatus Hydrogenedentes bacterium]|nr:ABC transporter permease [Candidatus Hydrogenedentota bacterium]
MYTDLLPITALIRRELLTSLRQQRYFWMIVVGVGVAIFFVLMEWPQGNALPFQMALRSKDIFFELAFVLAMGVVLVIPALAGSSIVTEREEETYELLAMTTARPWHVLLSKLLNAAGHFMVMLFALMPIAACAFFLVGLDIDLLWRTLAIIAASALLCAAAGVVCSAFSQRPMAAIGSSILAAILMLGLPCILFCIVLQLFDLVTLQSSMSFCAYFCPALVFMFNFSTPLPTETTACALVCIVASLLCIAAAHRGLRATWGTTLRTGPASVVTKFRVRLPLLALPQIFAPGVNPIYARDRYFDYDRSLTMRGFTIALPFLLSFSACTLIAIAAYVGPASTAQAAFLGWSILQAVLLSVLLAALTANLFTKERERGNMDMLRMTLVEDYDVVQGKLATFIYIARSMFLSALAGSVPILIAGPPLANDAFPAFCVLAIAMLVECLVLVAFATCFASLVSNKTSVAISLSIALSTMALIGNIFVLAIIMIPFEPIRVDGFEWLMGVSPLYSFLLNVMGPQSRIYQPGATIFCIFFTAAECWAYWYLCKRVYRFRYNPGS